jgi:hypothetical protein
MGLVNWRAAGFCNQALVPNLEGRSKALADTFKSQDVANTLWAYATMGREPVLEGRAEALAGTFNAQDVANTLWAYATMMREPGAGLMSVRELEGAGGHVQRAGRGKHAVGVCDDGAEAWGGLDEGAGGGRRRLRARSTRVGKTLWVYATMGREPRVGLMGELEGRAEAVACTFNAQDVAITLWQRAFLLFFAPLTQNCDG